MLGETLLVRFQAGADHVVDSAEAEEFHFFQGLIRGPAVFRHAVRRDRHASPVVAEAAVHKDFLAGILLDHLQESDERLIGG